MLTSEKFEQYVNALSVSALNGLDANDVAQCKRLVERAFEMHKLLMEASYQLDQLLRICEHDNETSCCYCDYAPNCQKRNVLINIDNITRI